MFNIHLYKKTIKQTWKVWFLLLLPSLLVVPLAFTISLDNAKNPQYQGVNFLDLILLGTKKNLFTISPVLFVGPSIFVIAVANTLFARDVESQNITFTIVTPLSKTRIFWTKSIHLFLSLWFGWIINLIILVSSIWASKNYDGFPMGNFIAKLTLLWVWFSAIGAIALLSSAFFNKSVWSITTSGLIIIGSIVINMIAMIVNQIEKTEWLKWLSLASLYTEASFYELDKLEMYLPHIIVLFILFIVCTIGAWQVFIKKDLPL